MYGQWRPTPCRLSVFHVVSTEASDDPAEFRAGVRFCRHHMMLHVLKFKDDGLQPYWINVADPLYFLVYGILYICVERIPFFFLW